MRLYKTQYSFRISGNRGYDSNRVRYILQKLTILKCGDVEFFVFYLSVPINVAYVFLCLIVTLECDQTV